MLVNDFYVKELLIPVFLSGKQVYHSPSVMEIQQFAKESLATMWDEYKRPMQPHIYKVDLSDQLYDLKKRLMARYSEVRS